MYPENTKHLCNVSPTSSPLDQHCTNVIQIIRFNIGFRVCWEQEIYIQLRKLESDIFYLIRRIRAVYHVLHFCCLFCCCFDVVNKYISIGNNKTKCIGNNRPTTKWSCCINAEAMFCIALITYISIC